MGIIVGMTQRHEEGRPRGSTGRPEDLTATLRRLLDAVENGELEADTPQGRRLLSYVTGALAALEVTEAARLVGGNPQPKVE